MKKVVCINDKQLPIGAEVVEGQTYTVRESFINGFDQRVYLLVGVRNKGRTKYGLPWYGYRSDRFDIIDGVKEEQKEVSYALN